VKLDAQIFNDGNEDFAWDAVWDVATRVDSSGWMAEFRIPLTQLPYGTQRSHVFGFTVDRDVYRYAQRVSWPLFRQSLAGFVSQFGEVDGLEDLAAPRRLEAAPYLVTKNVSQITNNTLERGQDLTVGGDFKYRVASNLKLDATINPDFGQVEADPGVLNLTGRLPGGFTIGALDAVTTHETGAAGVTIEPTTNYGVLRLRQDLRGGESSVGGIVTSVNRHNDSWSAPYLHSSAYVGAMDFRHRFPGGRYELSGSVDFSRVAGTAQAIANTQQSSTHYYQRPDVRRFDSTRTSLSGDAEGLQFGKVGGNHLLFQTNVERRSPGFEINDLGYLQRADQL